MTENNKRRVLIYSTAYYPFMAGAEVAVKEITDRLSTDFNFDMVTARLDKNLKSFEKVGSINVYRVGNGNKFWDKLLLPFRGAVFTMKLRRQNKYSCFWTVMVSFSSGAGFVSNILSPLVGLKKVPIVLNLQEGDPEEHLKYGWAGLISLSWKLALRNASHVTALSNFLLERAKKYGYKGDMSLVPNGVDIEIFTKETPLDERNMLANKLLKKESDIFLITTSRLNRKNAVDDIISSLKYLPQNISLLVLGIGEEGPKLQRQVVDLGLENRVKFLGFIKHEDMPKFLSVSEIFIRPSRSEGFGNSFIEAMASKVPVIATPVGGIPDFLSDKETGVFCSPDNPKSIAESVLLILNNKELKDRIVSNAQSMVLLRYSWEKVSKDMKQVLERVSGV